MDDAQYEETTIMSVEGSAATGGWSIKRADGWDFWVSAESPIEPRPGMHARFYGKGIGFNVRGLILDGVEVFYRTEAEDESKQMRDRYGKDSADWLARWDRGDNVWSVEMGGLGPGYEQCIQIMAAEMLRLFLASGVQPDAWLWDKEETWHEFDRRMNKTTKQLHPSGAQYDAAKNLAACIWRRGPQNAFQDPAAKDRLIQTSKAFPVLV